MLIDPLVQSPVLPVSENYLTATSYLRLRWLSRSRSDRVDLVLEAAGSAHNDTLMASLRKRLEPVPVRDLEAVSGIPGDAKEAVAFAVLANEAIHGHPANVPAATGAGRPVVLGKITV